MKNASSTLSLRPATPDDLSLLKQWDEQPHVLESDPDDDWQWETELQRSPVWREQLIAELEGRPIGFVQIIDPRLEDTRYWGDVPDGRRAIDIWIGEASDLGRGYGTQMMRLALDRCFAIPTVDSVWVDPLETNTRAHRFYERIGFEFVEKKRFDDQDCSIYQIKRKTYSNIP
ncbi:GNAT family N-acetyltransferase [Persicitalea jodogahamensis]|uniref:N-acetyltransferase domain-containing protein n=1 Tax=Persicitalea jodogahamensis TaxID=402147 RepID=A0A8J3D1Z6_9BACT|nr:GNAT family N-acetyltransferase [Persicitalea jodogahamensis]GHB55187.1 hypothetical protein GCM10007390_05460 [Persicitalea jodogahamensis]